MSCTIKTRRVTDHRLDTYKLTILDMLNTSPRPSYKQIAAHVTMDSQAHTTDGQISNYCNTRFDMAKPAQASDLMPEFHDLVKIGLSYLQAMSKLNSKHGTEYEYKTLRKAYCEYKNNFVSAKSVSMLNVLWNNEGMRGLMR